MHRERRVVVCVAAGLALAVVARAVVDLVTDVDGGWFVDQPSSDAPFSPSHRDTYTTAAIWLAAVGTWTLLSWRLFRVPSTPD